MKTPEEIKTQLKKATDGEKLYALSQEILKDTHIQHFEVNGYGFSYGRQEKTPTVMPIAQQVVIALEMLGNRLVLLKNQLTDILSLYKATDPTDPLRKPLTTYLSNNCRNSMRHLIEAKECFDQNNGDNAKTWRQWEKTKDANLERLLKTLIDQASSIGVSLKNVPLQVKKALGKKTIKPDAKATQGIRETAPLTVEKVIEYVREIQGLQEKCLKELTDSIEKNMESSALRAIVGSYISKMNAIVDAVEEKDPSVSSLLEKTVKVWQQTIEPLLSKDFTSSQEFLSQLNSLGKKNTEELEKAQKERVDAEKEKIDLADENVVLKQRVNEFEQGNTQLKEVLKKLAEEIQHLEAGKNRLSKDLQELTEKHDNLKVVLKGREGELTSTEGKLIAVTLQKDELNNIVIKLNNTINDLTENITSVNEEKRQLTDKVDGQQQEIDNLKNQHTAVQQAKNALQGQVESLQGQLSTLESKLHEQEQAFDEHHKNTNIQQDKLNDKVTTLEQENQQFRTQQANLESQIQQKTSENALLEQDKGSLQDQLHQQTADYQQVVQEIEGLRQNLKVSREAESALNNKLEMQKTQVTLLQLDKTDLEQKLDSLIKNGEELETKVKELTTKESKKQNTIDELKGQLRTLNEQGLSVEKDKIKHEEEHAALLRDLDNTKNEKEELSKRIKELLEEIIGLKTQIKDTDTAANEEKAERLKLNTQVLALTQETSTLSSEKIALNTQVVQQKEEITHLKREKDELEQKLIGLQGQSEQLEILNQQVRTKESEIADLKATNAQLKEEHNRLQTQETETRTKAEGDVRALEKKLSDLSKANDSLRQSMAMQEKSIKDLVAENAQYYDTFHRLDEEQKVLRAPYNRQIEELNKRINDKEQQLSEQARLIKQLEEEIVVLKALDIQKPTGRDAESNTEEGLDNAPLQHLTENIYLQEKVSQQEKEIESLRAQEAGLTERLQKSNQQILAVGKEKQDLEAQLTQVKKELKDTQKANEFQKQYAPPRQRSLHQEIVDKKEQIIKARDEEIQTLNIKIQELTAQGAQQNNVRDRFFTSASTGTGLGTGSLGARLPKTRGSSAQYRSPETMEGAIHEESDLDIEEHHSQGDQVSASEKINLLSKPESISSLIKLVNNNRSNKKTLEEFASGDNLSALNELLMQEDLVTSINLKGKVTTAEAASLEENNAEGSQAESEEDLLQEASRTLKLLEENKETSAWLRKYCRHTADSISDLQEDMKKSIAPTAVEPSPDAANSALENTEQALFEFHQDTLVRGQGRQYEVVIPTIGPQGSQTHILGGKCYEGEGLFDENNPSSQGAVNARRNNRVDFVIKLTKEEDIEKSMLSQMNEAKRVRNAAAMVSVLQFMTNFKGSPSAENPINLSYNGDDPEAQENAKQIYFALKHLLSRLDPTIDLDKAINMDGIPPEDATRLRAEQDNAEYEKFHKSLTVDTRSLVEKFVEDYQKRKQLGQEFKQYLTEAVSESRQMLPMDKREGKPNLGNSSEKKSKMNAIRGINNYENRREENTAGRGSHRHKI